MMKMNNWITAIENDNYEINEQGEIRRKETKHILKPAKIKNGYLTVVLTKNSKCKTYLLHRLVANNFIKNTNGYKEINHIDGNKLNNNVENLEWCTRSHNLLEAYRTGLKKQYRNNENKNSKKVKQTILNTKEEIIWNSISEASRKKGYSTGSICDACKGNLKTAYKSKWEYV